MPETIELSISNLGCVRSGRMVFRGLNFQLGRGQALAIEGANGAGKTSLLRVLAGFLPQAFGSVHLNIDGTEIGDGEERGKHVGWLGHSDGIKPQMSVHEALAFYAAFYGAHIGIGDALHDVGLARARDLPCQYLSAGQRKRLALARLKLSGRALWLMDEPLAALDAAGKKLSAAMISAHCARGGIAVIATHEPLGIAAQTLSLAAA